MAGIMLGITNLYCLKIALKIGIKLHCIIFIIVYSICIISVSYI